MFHIYILDYEDHHWGNVQEFSRATISPTWDEIKHIIANTEFTISSHTNEFACFKDHGQILSQGFKYYNLIQYENSLK